MSKLLSKSLLAAWLLAGSGSAACLGQALEVLAVTPGKAAEHAGLKSGDRLLAWERRHQGETVADGRLDSLFDLWQVETEEAPRGGLRLEVVTPGKEPRWCVPPPRPWGLTVRLIDPETALPSSRWVLAAHGQEKEAADRLWLRALEAASDLPAADRAHLASRFARRLLTQDRFPEALAQHEAALRLRRSLDPASLATAASLDDTGIAAWYLGDEPRVRRLWQEALEIRQQSVPDSLLVAKSLNNIALLEPFEKRIELSRRALEIRRRLDPESSEMANQLTNLGVAYQKHGDLDQAENLMRQAEALLARIAPQDRRRGVVLMALPGVHRLRGELAQAEVEVRRAITFFEANAPRSFDLAAAWMVLGGLLVDTHQAETAEVYLHQALDLFRELAPENHRILPVLLNLGLAAKQRGEASVARRHYLAAVAHGREHLSPDSETRIDVGIALNNLGSLAQSQGDDKQAEDFYRQAIEVLKPLASGAFELARSRMNLGRCLVRRGATNDAGQLLTAALAVQAARSPGSVEQAMSLAGLARLAELRADPAAAAELYSESLEALEADRFLQTGGDLARARGRAQVAHLLYDHIEFLLSQGDRETAFAVSERLRARSFRDLLNQRNLRPPERLTSAEQTQLRRLRLQHDRLLEALAAETDADRLASLRRDLEAQREAQRKILADSAEPVPARRRPTAIPRPQRGEVVLSYLLGERSCWLLVATEDGVEAHRLAIDQGSLEERVESFRQAIERREHLGRARFRRLAEDLGEVLLAPAQDALEGAQRVVVLPDGSLHRLPFAALAAPSDRQRYWIETTTLSIAPSFIALRDLRQRQRDLETAAGVTAFGVSNPQVTMAATERSSGGLALPAARDEAREIAALFAPHGASFLDDQATEERFRSLGASARIIHFASHAWFDEDSPLDSGLAFARPAKLSEGRQNGLLQTWEILEQVEVVADLVTLSGCQTGLGQAFAGEGLLGLTRALQLAGARSVVASTWRVNDASTRTLMVRFYGRVKAGESFAEALRASQRELIQHRHGDSDLSPPFHWAGFQLFGDGSARWTTAP
ncbi:MAG: CHAT domain-containing protein [Acidobacteriota bacterium]